VGNRPTDKTEDSKMTSRTTTNEIYRRRAADSPEEEAVLVRFFARVGRGTHKAVGALSHGSFLVL
jgi:hypothetical protein